MLLREGSQYPLKLKLNTPDLLFTHAYRYFSTMKRKPIIDKLARKKFSSPKKPTKKTSPEE
jgi:hypothetical protein